MALRLPSIHQSTISSTTSYRSHFFAALPAASVQIMAGQSPRERLWPEVQQQILMQMDSFCTLHALMAASPRFYQVFRHNKMRIMSTMTRRRFSSTAIQAALAMETLCQTQDPPFSEDAVPSFFDLDLHELENLLIRFFRCLCRQKWVSSM